MRFDPGLVLPDRRNDYRGPALAAWFLAVYTLVATTRSLFHILAPDGGAGSIAHIDVSVPGGQNIVALFGQWGLEQLLLVAISWVVLLRYRVFVPLMLGLASVDLVGRFLVGQLKPIEAAATPPGTIATWVGIPLLLTFFAISLVRRDEG